MKEFFRELISSNWQLTMPHGICLLNEPHVIIMMNVADFVIALSYIGIGLELHRLNKAAKDVTNFNIFLHIGAIRGAVSLYGAFIVLCGIGHLWKILVVYFGDLYEFQGYYDLLTAGVSFATYLLTMKIRRSVQHGL